MPSLRKCTEASAIANWTRLGEGCEIPRHVEPLVTNVRVCLAEVIQLHVAAGPIAIGEVGHCVQVLFGNRFADHKRIAESIGRCLKVDGIVVVIRQNRPIATNVSKQIGKAAPRFVAPICLPAYISVVTAVSPPLLYNL